MWGSSRPVTCSLRSLPSATRAATSAPVRSVSTATWGTAAWAAASSGSTSGRAPWRTTASRGGGSGRLLECRTPSTAAITARVDPAVWLPSTSGSTAARVASGTPSLSRPPRRFFQRRATRPAACSTSPSVDMYTETNGPEASNSRAISAWCTVAPSLGLLSGLGRRPGGLEQLPHLLVGGLRERPVGVADGAERPRGGDADDLVGLAPQLLAGGRRRRRHRDHDLGG